MTKDVLHCARCGCFQQPALVDGVLRPQCPVCGYVTYNNPYPCVSVLVVRDGKALLGKRSEKSIYPGLWCLPCGYIEYEESFLAAALRETAEETGLAVTVKSIVNVVSNRLGDVHSLVVTLLAESEDGEAVPGDDITETAWFASRDALPPMAFQADAWLLRKFFDCLDKGTEMQGIPLEACDFLQD